MSVAAASVLIVVLDQLTKALMLRRGEPIPAGPAVTGRRRAITGRPGLVDMAPGIAAPLWIATAAAAIVLVAMIPKGAPAPVAIGIGLGIGGALSNLIDRLARGGVVDFIAIGPWPRFNVADAGLVAGLGLVALGLL
jgi:signal peptidase II